MEFKYPDIPKFCRRDGNAILYDGPGELHYYIPKNYFDGKSAIQEGSYIRLLGSFTYRIIQKNGTKGELRTFNWPTVFLCRPSAIDNQTDAVLEEGMEPANYTVLIFVDGDQLVTNVFTPQDIDNTKELMSLHIMTGKVPNTIPYNELFMYLYKSMELNGNKFDIHSQLMGLIYSKICRDPEDVKNLFRMSKSIDTSLRGYKTMSVKEAPKYISPFTSLTSENMDEGIVSSVLMSEDIEEGKAEHIYSPLEKVMMM